MNKILRYSFVVLLTMIFGSAWAEEVTMKYTGTETSNLLADGSNEAATVGLDASAWSVVAEKGAATNAPGLNKAGDIRLYYNAGGSNTIEVKSLTNATIKKIAISFTDAQYSNVSVTVNGNAVTGTDGVFEINNPSFVLGNGNTSNVQVRISQIVISYEGGAPIDVLAPKFSVSSGTYYTPQTVALSCETEGAKILYTIPAGQDPVYVDDSNYTGVFYDGNPLTISQTTTIKAMAVKNGKTSSISTAVYTIKQLEEVNVAKALEIINALENGKTTEDVYQVKGIIVGTPDFQRDKDNKLYGNVNFTMSDGDGSTALLTVYRAKDLENKNFTEETINRIKAGDKVVVQGNLQKYVAADNVVTPEIKNCFLVSVTAAGGTTTEDTWTVAGTLPLTDKEWDPTDTNGDMLPNGNGAGVSSYERDNIVLEAGKNYECKVVKNHSWDNGSYPESNYVIKVDETAKYHVKIFFNTTTHEVFHEIAKMGEAGPITHTWSVTGTLVGGWDIDVDMTKGEDGLYKAEIENVAAGTYKFKVRADKLWTTSYPANDYELTVEKDGSNVTVTFDEAKEEVKAIVSMPIEKNAVWSFTSWSKSTVSALIADAAASASTGWSDIEKADATEPTEASKDNCFWSVAEPNEDGSLSANGEVIAELKGLVWNKKYTTARSLAIAVNYASTSLGDYAGGAYLWLGGGKKKVPCFTIPGVKAGSTVTMEVESHKPAEGRGVELYTGVDADGLVDAATKIGDSFTPTTKDSHTWTIDADCDVIVYNTNGCHIYSIKVEAGSTGISTVKAQKTQNNVIYNLAGQKVGNDYKGIVIMNGKKFMQK